MPYDFHLEEISWPKVSAIHENVIDFAMGYIFVGVVHSFEKRMSYERTRVKTLRRINCKAAPQQVKQVLRGLFRHFRDLSHPVSTSNFVIKLFLALDQFNKRRHSGYHIEDNTPQCPHVYLLIILSCIRLIQKIYRR